MNNFEIIEQLEVKLAFSLEVEVIFCSWLAMLFSKQIPTNVHNQHFQQMSDYVNFCFWGDGSKSVCTEGVIHSTEYYPISTPNQGTILPFGQQ